MKKEKTKKDEPVIKLTLKTVGRIYKSTGNTFEEAVNNIKIPGGTKATGILTVEKRDYKKERIINGRHTNGLFGQGSPSMRAIHLKSVREMLGV